jgi:hypothetical protein
VAKYGQCGGTTWTGCTSCAVSFFFSPSPRFDSIRFGFDDDDDDDDGSWFADDFFSCWAVWVYVPGQWVLLAVLVGRRKRVGVGVGQSQTETLEMW